MDVLYEAMLVVDPGQSDDDLSATIEQIKSIIARADGQVESAYPVFRRRLAYPIGNHTEGTYVLVYFRGAQAVEELKRDLQMSTTVLRLMVVQANPKALWLEGPPHPPAPQRRPEREEAPAQESPAPAKAEPEAEESAPEAGEEAEAPAEAEEAPAEAADAPEESAEEEASEAAEPEADAEGAETSEEAPEAEEPEQDASS